MQDHFKNHELKKEPVKIMESVYAAIMQSASVSCHQNIQVIWEIGTFWTLALIMGILWAFQLRVELDTFVC
jgi:hypothetical protein